MSKHKAFARAIVVAGAALVAFLILSLRPVGRPPVLSFVSTEPAGVMDDNGMEMLLVTLSISNSDNRPPTPQNHLYIKENARPIQVRIANRWIEMQETSIACELAPSHKRERLLLLPASADLCRVSVKYTGASLANKGVAAWLAERLPRWIRFRMSYKFWRWVGFTQYEPSSHWQGFSVELPIRE